MSQMNYCWQHKFPEYSTAHDVGNSPVITAITFYYSIVTDNIRNLFHKITNYKHKDKATKTLDEVTSRKS